MDTFMERLSHRINPQDMIQANSAAEAAEMEQLRKQMEEYDTLLQDMRKVNLKAAENMEQMQQLLQTSLDKIENVKDNETPIPEMKRKLEELVAQSNDAQTQRDELMAEIDRKMEAMSAKLLEQVDGLAPKVKEQIDESFNRSDDFAHRENVKVYRNVQACVTEELDKRTDILIQKQQESAKKQKALLPISIVIMLAVLADILINLFGIVVRF